MCFKCEYQYPGKCWKTLSRWRRVGLAAVASFQSIYSQAPLHGDVCVLEASPLQLGHPEGFDNSIFDVAFCSPCLNPCLPLEQNFPSKLRIIQLLHLRPGWTKFRLTILPLQRHESFFVHETRFLQHLEKTDVHLYCRKNPLASYASFAVHISPKLGSKDLYSLLCSCRTCYAVRMVEVARCCTKINNQIECVLLVSAFQAEAAPCLRSTVQTWLVFSAII